MEQVDWSLLVSHYRKTPELGTKPGNQYTARKTTQTHPAFTACSVNPDTFSFSQKWVQDKFFADCRATYSLITK